MELDSLNTDQQQIEYKRYDLAISAANMGVWDWFLDTEVVYFSKIWKAQIGYRDDELENSFATWVEHLHPDESEIVQKKVSDYIENPIGKYVNEFRFRHKNGSYIWIEAKAEVIKDENGNVTRLFGAHTDITKRKVAEQEIKTLNAGLEELVNSRTKELELTVSKLNTEIKQRVAAEDRIKDALRVKELLLKEITHRVKNNLQIISSLVNLQKNIADDHVSIGLLNQTANRIQAMALIHEALYKSDEYEHVSFRSYIASLIDYISITFDTSNVKIETDIDDFAPTLATATSCGMIILELITNSMKYAFPEKSNARINIQLKSVDQNNFKLIFSDNGIGFPKSVNFRKVESLGMQVVISLAEQLNGEIALLEGSGTTFVLTFKEE
jgi:PAS domain S-box-containing protein